ncbi:LuxR C-terminal-related transcriptional regulator [Streptomyces monticola]|uniref:LuxR C-terminal-related transcriptional regulator n=1 Tax=Streptomyces monticola TaxID=2666263 RepID=A0ABW2JWD6_9ACTN
MTAPRALHPSAPPTPPGEPRALHPSTPPTPPGEPRALRPSTPPTPPGDPSGIAQLTPRERQVLALVSQAAQNREIAGRLGIAERTVKAHLANLMGKIDVETRIQAAIFAYAHHHALIRPAPREAGNRQATGR